MPKYIAYKLYKSQVCYTDLSLKDRSRNIGLEAFSLYNYQLKSLDFVTNRFFMKLFRTSNIHVVSDCQEQFNFVLPNVQLARRAEKFVKKKMHVDEVY